MTSSLLDLGNRPFTSLTATFCAWKSFLLAIALGAVVGPDYDTSTSLFFAHAYGNDTTTTTTAAAAVPSSSSLAARLTRWDALYFVYASRKGYVYEQQWAFGPGLPTVVRYLAALLTRLSLETTDVWDPLIAITVAHVSHLVAVLALYQLTVVVCNDKKLGFVAASLHVLSPAGLFLSAPCAESPFAALSFVGNLLFAVGLKDGPDSLKRNIALVAAGGLFGISATFRSNALFSGLLFAVEAFKCLASLRDSFTVTKLLRFPAPIIGGLLVAVGIIAPQVTAWNTYCAEGIDVAASRPWCSRLIPSIYTFVQDHYWNVGFLRYWTLNQLPLFLLASPMLTILITSGFQVLREPSSALRLMTPTTNKQNRILVQTLAAGQILLAILAITNYHVQVITRLSSGYPVWYWWVAACLIDPVRRSRGYGITVFMIMYAGIQGSLFASFLPPA